MNTRESWGQFQQRDPQLRFPYDREQQVVRGLLGILRRDGLRGQGAPERRTPFPAGAPRPVQGRGTFLRTDGRKPPNLALRLTWSSRPGYNTVSPRGAPVAD
jgi:hypothetical protein